MRKRLSWFAESSLLMLFINVEFSPDIVITKRRKPDRIEKTLATKFKASLLLVKVCVRK